jgi:drug/metabolite transporter (DMT)-like permease
VTDLKNTVSTIAGILVAVCGVILALPAQGIALPEVVILVATIISAVAAAIMGVLIGRNADGSAKTPEQIAAQEKAAGK